MTILLLDNGGGCVKAGLHEDPAVEFGASPQRNIPQPTVLPNMTAKVQKSMQYLVADQINEFLNASLLTFVRPFERGYLTNVQCELEVWKHVFQDKCLVKPYESTLVLTEPLLNLPSIQNDLNEVVFEYFNFQSCLRQPAPCFTAYGQIRADPKLTGLTVIDSGFSFTHVVPFIQNKLQKHAIKRINIGGKLLTNYLKELVSYRQWNMMDEFVLMNQVKEQLCFVSNDLVKDLEEGRKLSRAQRVDGMRDHLGGRLKKHFVLPDFQSILKGYVKPDAEPIEPHEQVLVMETERISVPEVLFQPSILGLNQGGLVEATAQAWQSLSLVEQGLACQRVVLSGGNVNLPNLSERFARAIRTHIPSLFRANIHTPSQPELAAYYGMYEFVTDQLAAGRLQRVCVSKQQYEEWGSDRVNSFFEKQYC